jgi:hypothetical protein
MKKRIIGVLVGLILGTILVAIIELVPGFLLLLVFGPLYLVPLTGVVLLLSIWFMLSGAEESWGIPRSQWGLLTIVAASSSGAVLLIWLFNYYHWSSGIAFLDHFDPNIDVLKAINVVLGLMSLVAAGLVKAGESDRAFVLAILAALPGISSIFIYG